MFFFFLNEMDFLELKKNTFLFWSTWLLFLAMLYDRSDVLGQFMPLVGKDWSQTGVAHLFSAIKVCYYFSNLEPSFSDFDSSFWVFFWSELKSVYFTGKMVYYYITLFHSSCSSAGDDHQYFFFGCFG